MNRIKRIIITVAVLILASHVSAQTYDTIPNYNLGSRLSQSTTIMGLSDGSILGGMLMADFTRPYLPLGYVLQKVTRLAGSDVPNCLFISDTLFIPYEQFPWHLTERDPQGDGNILAEFYNDFENENCFFKIRRFTDDLVVDTTEVIVPLAHSLGTAGDPGILLDPNGDFVLIYRETVTADGRPRFVRHHLAKIGLDGTFKHHAAYDTLDFNLGSECGPLVFSESPLQYLCYGEIKSTSNRTIACYVFDSLFNMTAHYTLPYIHGWPDYVHYKSDSFHTKLLGMDDGCFLAARGYHNIYQFNEEDGVAVMKFDSDLNLLARTKFPSEPYIELTSYGATAIGLEKGRDGSIYFAYFTHCWTKPSQLSVVKMDSDLNIIWQRHCLAREDGRDYSLMEVLDDNSVAVMGIRTIYTSLGYFDHTEVFYVVVNDDYDGMEEQGFIVRPYAYWPNPAQDELNLQYSPDVEPKQVELYDLQGRLVRSQTNAVESLNMEGLAAGQYVMKVTMEDGKTFTDKVVKE